MKIVGTVTQCVQVGVDSWQDFRHSKIFDASSSISDINAFAKNIHESLSFLDVVFSRLDQQPQQDKGVMI